MTVSKYCWVSHKFISFTVKFLFGSVIFWLIKKQRAEKNEYWMKRKNSIVQRRQTEWIKWKKRKKDLRKVTKEAKEKIATSERYECKLKMLGHYYTSKCVHWCAMQLRVCLRANRACRSVVVQSAHVRQTECAQLTHTRNGKQARTVLSTVHVASKQPDRCTFDSVHSHVLAVRSVACTQAHGRTQTQANSSALSPLFNTQRRRRARA